MTTVYSYRFSVRMFVRSLDRSTLMLEFVQTTRPGKELKVQKVLESATAMVSCF